MSDASSAAAWPRENGRKHWIRESVETVVVVVVLLLFCRTFVMQAFRIPSGSMEETLKAGDFLLVNKLVYGAAVPFTEHRLPGYGSPERGDVAVFRFPRNPNRDFIKRVIGLPGDLVELKGGRAYVNGEAVDEPYLKLTAPRRRPPGVEQANIVPPGSGNKDYYGPVTVPPGHYFVLGDNRDSSEDSRYWGFLPETHLVGKAQLIYMSFESLRHPRWRRFGKVVS